MPNLDLNLLTALHALLQERSVTRAAERLGLAQPTLSGNLGRLRRHFNDELLHRVGNSYELTPLAAHLAERTGNALDGVNRLFAAQPVADPATSTREFVIITSDYGAAVFGPPLTADLTRAAPHAGLQLHQTDPMPYTTSFDLLRGVDGVLMPHGFFGDLPHVDVFEDRWVCVVDVDNPDVGDELHAADLTRLPWASTAALPGTGSMGMRRLLEAGVAPTVQAVVDSFLALPLLVVRTRRIALLPRRLAAALEHPRLRVLECPVRTGPLVIALWWHPDFEQDAEHAWLREQVSTVAAALG